VGREQTTEERLIELAQQQADYARTGILNSLAIQSGLNQDPETEIARLLDFPVEVVHDYLVKLAHICTWGYKSEVLAKTHKPIPPDIKSWDRVQYQRLNLFTQAMLGSDRN
jgi:hypothetical protein